MAEIQVRKTDLKMSECCGEKTEARLDTIGPGIFKVVLYCVGCCSPVKEFVRQIWTRRQA